jgi:hypothetical protein
VSAEPGTNYLFVLLVAALLLLTLVAHVQRSAAFKKAVFAIWMIVLLVWAFITWVILDFYGR